MNYSHRCIPGLFWLLAVTAFLFSFTHASRAAEAEGNKESQETFVHRISFSKNRGYWE